MTSIKIIIDLDLKDLIPGYLANRKSDIKSCKGYLLSGKFEEIMTIGHRLKGNARTYGFLYLEEIGVLLEECASNKEAGQIEELIMKYENYLNNIEIFYEEI